MLEVAVIYLDYAASCPVDPRIEEAMKPYWSCGNAASRHQAGTHASDTLEECRAKIAAAIGALPHTVILTSGATESDNLAAKGYADANPHPAIVTAASEHKAVLSSVEYLGRHRAVPSKVLPVNSAGKIDLGELWRSLRPGALVSIMAVNNETGVVQDIREIGEICRQKQCLFHCDAAQGFGRLPLDVDDLQVDMLSLSAHKVYGPKGIGALYVRDGMRLTPQVHGGGQEQGLRAGTSNVPLAVGFAKAAKLATEDIPGEAKRLHALRRLVVERVHIRFPELRINGSGVPGILNLGFPGVDQRTILDEAAESMCCSAGSACNLDGPSYVLKAMGLSDGAALRVSLGRWTTEDDAAKAADAIGGIVRRLRAAS